LFGVSNIRKKTSVFFVLLGHGREGQPGTYFSPGLAIPSKYGVYFILNEIYGKINFIAG